MATVNTSTGTYLANLFDPEVIGAMLETKLMSAIKLAPLAIIDTTLVGRPGDTIKLPYYNYIGAAEEVAEGHDIPIRQLTEQTTDVKIKKIGNGVQITDEAALSGYGDPVGQAVKQLVDSIADAVDNQLLAALDANENVHTAASFTADEIADAGTLFGEDYDGEKYLLVDPKGYAALRKTDDWISGTEIGGNMLVNGVVGMIHGAQVIVTSRIKADESGKVNYHLVKPGALAIYTKRDTLVEYDRDIINKSSVITADKHFAPYLVNASKAVRIEVAAQA